MELTIELVISLVISAGAGAGSAFYGNRVVNAEIWGHIKQHCVELSRISKTMDKIDLLVNDHREQLARVDQRHKEQDRALRKPGD